MTNASGRSPRPTGSVNIRGYAAARAKKRKADDRERLRSTVAGCIGYGGRWAQS